MRHNQKQCDPYMLLLSCAVPPFCCSSVVLLLLALLISIARSGVYSTQLGKVMEFDYCRGLGYNCVSDFAVCSHLSFPAHFCSSNRIPSYGVNYAYDSPS